jgi:hypothetical protein
MTLNKEILVSINDDLMNVFDELSIQILFVFHFPKIGILYQLEMICC